MWGKNLQTVYFLKWVSKVPPVALLMGLHGVADCGLLNCTNPAQQVHSEHGLCAWIWTEIERWAKKPDQILPVRYLVERWVRALGYKPLKRIHES